MSEAAPKRRLAPWQAVVALVLGGGMAQTAGLVIALLVIALLAMRGGGGGIEAMALSFPVIGASALGVGLTLLLVSLVTPLIFGVPIREALGLRPPPALATLATMVGVMGLGPLSELLVEGMKQVAPSLTFNTLGMLDSVIRETPTLLLWPVLALSPGICEELFFRGLVQRAFGKRGMAIAVSAISFSLFHIDPHHVVGVLPIGFYLAWVAVRTSSTWVTVVAHVLNNTVSIIAAKIVAADPASESEPTPRWVVVAGLLVAAASVVAIRRLTREAGATIAPAPRSPADLPPQGG